MDDFEKVKAKLQRAEKKIRILEDMVENSAARTLLFQSMS